jgi:hypothetical protein
MKIAGNDKGYTIFELITSLVGIGLMVAVVWGYVLNIIAVIALTDLPVSLMFIIRCIGLVIVPLGSILGLFF